MNHIDELMKTAGCKTSPRGCTNEDVNENTDYLSNDCEGDCIDCTWYDPDEYYPDFTAEKQLELIKLIGKVKDFNCFFDNSSREWFFSAGLELPIIFDLQESNQDFAQALAQLTTELLKAGELDKHEVKEILEQ